jgi:hypothetical protein
MSTKHTFLFLIILFTSPFVAAQTAGEYMDEMNKDMKSISQASWEYVSEMSHGNNAKKAEKKRLDLLQQFSDSKSRVAQMSGFNGNTVYRDAVVKYLDMSFSIFNQDYANLVDMEEVAEQSYDFMEAYMLAKEKANEKLDEAGKEMDKAEEAFAKENNINLIDPEKTKTSENIRISNLVYDHYNVIYLIFFKSYKQEYFLLQALNNGDVSAVEQNKNALIANSNEGIAKLKTMTGYNNDNSIIMSCKKLLEFYKSEAEKDVPVLLEFFLKKDNMDKVKAAFDAKKEKDRTQADADQYNKAIEEYNATINTFNSTNEKLNAERSKNLDAWNKSVDTFLDKNVPK